MKFLLKADLITQRRNIRSLIIALVMPIVILVSWRSVVEKVGGPFALSSSITFGLIAVGIMGYSNSVARDREKGVFQRLRAAPVSATSIMGSRLLIQLGVVLLMMIVVFLAGYFLDHIILSPLGYALSILAAIVGGALYLTIGQAIVGQITSAETVNSVSRLLYFAFIFIGAFGELGILGPQMVKIVSWTPYGTVKNVLLGAMQPSMWTGTTSLALLITLIYIVIFGVWGIKKFKWAT